MPVPGGSAAFEGADAGCSPEAKDRVRFLGFRRTVRGPATRGASDPRTPDGSGPVRLIVEISDAGGGMFQGIVHPDTEEALSFHGTLELVAILESVVGRDRSEPGSD